jgi:hypothetical protein
MTTEQEEMRKESTSALEAELGYIERSLSWTSSRAGREGKSISPRKLEGPSARARILRKEIERRKAAGER